MPSPPKDKLYSSEATDVGWAAQPSASKGAIVPQQLQTCRPEQKNNRAGEELKISPGGSAFTSQRSHLGP